jgi:hypothetical protein
MARRFGQSRGADSVCVPESLIDNLDLLNDENNCQRFLSSPGKTREEREQNACLTCEFFPTKSAAWKRETAWIENLISDADRIRNVRDASRQPIDFNEVSYWQFEAVMIFDGYEKAWNDHEQRELVETLHILKSAFVKG